MQEIAEECIPKKQVRKKKTRKRTNECMPMNRKSWSKIKKKQRLWERLKRTAHKISTGMLKWNTDN